jgi:hypothetical protein
MKSFLVKLMFIRFVSGEFDEDLHVSAGLFCAATNLYESVGLPDYEVDVLAELQNWFNRHLESPFYYLPRGARCEDAICWFKSTAREHIARAWELVAILERNNILIWTIKSVRPGYVYYEDEVQVFARPYRDLRPWLRR